MADINLLQNNHPTKTPEGGAVPHSLNYIGAFIFVIVVLASAGLWYISAKADSQDKNIVTQTDQAKTQITSLPNYAAFVNEQTSLQGLSFLVQNHENWSVPLTKLASITYKTATYSTVTIGQDGSATLDGLIPSYADLDKYLQALNNKTLSPSITSATLESVSNGTSAAASLGGSIPNQLSFVVFITFDKSMWGIK